MPRKYRVDVTRTAERDVEAIYAPYRTIFRVARSTVIIVRVIHGAQLLDLDILERP